ncbi:hypothetical protein BACCAC_02789 [Bacteroides caccae ATCC 43185]|nr:hypothetical protein BACCAC_02789 [Bacteroides caccae ATCC 43185]
MNEGNSFHKELPSYLTIVKKLAIINFLILE